MTATTTPRPDATAPPASRVRRLGWRNPRLLVGLVLVAGSVLLGARMMAAADDTVGVWALVKDLPAGAVVHSGDLERRQVRFPDTATADRYLSADADLPENAVLSRPLGTGELLPRGALERAGRPDTLEVALSVAADDLPATVRQGSEVDVWVTPKVAATAGEGPPAKQVLDDVVVVGVPRRSDTLAPQATRQVIVGVPAARATALGAAFGAMADGRVVVVKVG